MFILSTVAGLSWILVLENITFYVAEFILSVTKNPWIILGMINIFLFLFGCVLEAVPIMVLTIPSTPGSRTRSILRHSGAPAHGQGGYAWGTAAPNLVLYKLLKIT